MPFDPDKYTRVTTDLNKSDEYPRFKQAVGYSMASGDDIRSGSDFVREAIREKVDRVLEANEGQPKRRK